MLLPGSLSQLRKRSEEGDRFSNVPERMKEDIPFRHIAIEGVPHSHKTRFAQMLAHFVGGRVVLDPRDNPYLRDFYEEKEGAAFLAQLVFLINRYHQQVLLAQRDLFADRIICDYLFEKDKIYAYQTLTDDELIIYEKIFAILAERVAKPDLTIYLQISLPTLRKRIAREGDDLEKNITESYLHNLLQAFDYFFFNYQATPLLVVKSDELDLTNEGEIMDIIRQVKNLKKGHLYYVPSSYGQKKP